MSSANTATNADRERGAGPAAPVVPTRLYAGANWSAVRPVRRRLSPDLAVGIAVALACPIAVALAFVGR